MIFLDEWKCRIKSGNMKDRLKSNIIRLIEMLPDQQQKRLE
jgi:hypothetical protein